MIVEKSLLMSVVIFVLGLCGVFLTRKNLIIILMSIELILLSINYNFILFSVYLDDMEGQLFALFILTVAAAESAIGLALVVVYYRLRGVISVNVLNLIKG